jgi:hypothetical protein
MVPRSSADALRGTVTAVVVGVWSILMPASELPHRFGYYAAVAAFLLGLRFGFRAIGMFFVCCIAIAIANAAGRGACTASSNNVRCGFDAAAPILIFGYFVGPTIVGALSSGFVRTSRVVRSSTQGVFDHPRDRGTLLPGRTIVVALAAATTAFLGFALVPLHGARLFLPALAACVAFGLAPSYATDDAPVPAVRSGVPSW